MLYAKGYSLSFTAAFDTNALSCLRPSVRPFQDPSTRARKVCRTQCVSVVPLCWRCAPIVLVSYNWSQRKKGERTTTHLVRMPHKPSQLLLDQRETLQSFCVWNMSSNQADSIVRPWHLKPGTLSWIIIDKVKCMDKRTESERTCSSPTSMQNLFKALFSSHKDG